MRRKLARKRRKMSRPDPKAAKLLEQIPQLFHDDGCSNSPDGLFGFNFRWACRIHDWMYCTRCHKPGLMNYHRKLVADRVLKINIAAALPFRWRWVKHVYYAAVYVAGGLGSFNSCGRSAGERCRHNMPIPDWMRVD